jgi:hypothetical protein
MCIYIYVYISAGPSLRGHQAAEPHAYEGTMPKLTGQNYNNNNAFVCAGGNHSFGCDEDILNSEVVAKGPFKNLIEMLGSKIATIPTCSPK